MRELNRLKNFTVFILVVLLTISTDLYAGGINATDTLTNIEPSKDQSEEIQIMTALLLRHHYRKEQLNDSLSLEIYENYLNSLDPNRLYFTEADLEPYNLFRFSFDDFVMQGNLNMPFQMFNMFREKLVIRVDKNIETISNGFDFSKEEYYDSDRENAKWATSETELDESWRKLLKSQYLSLKLAESNSPDSILISRYQRLKNIFVRYDGQDVFQYFANAFTSTFDPHTNYFSPRAKENFDIEMSRSLEGIGATLATINDYTTVMSIVPGGPADKSDELYANDRIIAVGQGKSKPFVDVVGWRVEEVVKLIRGPKGTHVRLKVLPASEGANAIAKTIVIERDKVKLKDQSAKLEMIPYKVNGKSYNYALIDIPAFYFDFKAYQNNEKDVSSTTNDVKKLILEAKSKNVDGIVIDLRRNGGGALQEAINLTGLFIDKGPVVQVKNSYGSIEVGMDTDEELVYDGPLAVLTSRESASASEIFAGAIQDYKRGAIIGEVTYGKGTVQSVVDLARFIKNPDGKLGELKLTQAKYYRISGNSTQNKGVIPDIEFPSVYDYSKFGESSLDNSLPWDEIKSADYNQVSMINDEFLKKYRSDFKSRLSTESNLKNYVDDVNEARNIRSSTTISLNEAERLKEIEEHDKKRAKSDNLDQKLEADEVKTGKDETEIDDVMVDEAFKFISAYITAKLG
ncbi:carboxy terminal-processing peptidase [Marinigracilibium pacificum]|uniref:Carboxy terminal-processing peptidase n=1 Tax=Marinigracilibium pacificum TaxID=2729599 RepID=A0A848J0T1_9BACT|nr:carboxy terminal-processing peptidase [Marinigracilibium pacificum]NMM49271.1 carboxy terminal-processing peptidase [Marinigracilibium pacificum]